MLSRVSQRSVASRRLLHTTTVNHGFMDWFNMKKEEKSKKKVHETPEDITKVIERAEKGEVQVTKVDKIEFIGKKTIQQSAQPLADRLQGFSIKHWLAKDKVFDAAQFEKIILEEYTKLTQKSVDSLDLVILDNLNLRFELTKNVQARSGYFIPDYTLSKASTGEVLQEYFESEILSGNHLKHGDSLDLTELEFDAPNVYVQQYVTSAERKSKFKKLLKEAKLAQEEKAQELIQGVRS